MSEIWNPWHGCKKISEGCQNCYMYYLDAQRNQLGSTIYKVKNNFNAPLKKKKNGEYRIESGKEVLVCLTSDFFLEEADDWRKEVWEMMRVRSDLLFWILTKRPERVMKHLPKGWKNGWENIVLSVTAENQKRADERIPILLELPFKHKGIMAAPLLEEIHIEPYLKTGQIFHVNVSGENYIGARPCHYEWIKSLQNQCKQYQVTLDVFELGSNFIKDGKIYHLTKKQQKEQAIKSGLNYIGKKENFLLTKEESQQLSFEWI